MMRIKSYTRFVSTSDLIFISVAARMLSMHPQTLRKYERLGLVQPARTIGSMRLYSDAEIERLRLIKVLVEDAGVNLAGVQRLLAVAEGLQRIEPLLDDLALGRSEAKRRLVREVVRLKEVVGL
jgi:MerR family transcriptional regulator/heat shock protein HspR